MNIQKYDSRTQSLIEEILEQKRTMSEDVFETLPKLLQIAQNNNDYALSGFAYFHIADTLYSFEKDYSLVRENLAKAIYFLGLADENELLARAYNFVAIDALNNGSYDVGYHYLMNAMQTCEDVENSYLKSIINNNLGQVFGRMRSYEKAVDYIKLGNEQQELCSKDDIYYYPNMVNGYFSEGMLYALMGDIEKAKETDRKIAEIEKEVDLSNVQSVFIPISFLRLMVAILEKDEDLIEARGREAVQKLKESHLIYDFIMDIQDLCRFLIEKDYLGTAKSIIDIVKETVDETDVVLMKKIVCSMEIAYYEKTGDDEEVLRCLRELYDLSEQQEMEQNRIYQYSIDLINMMDEQRKEQEKVMKENVLLHSQVQTDPLTGIPNRLMLDELLPELFEKAQKEEISFGVSLMDIDRFKEYNDTYGHLAGDICLQKVAKAIEKVSNKPGVSCARYGGDEFIMLYDNKSDEEIMRIAEELNKEIFDLNIEHVVMGDSGRVSMSQGICNSIPKKDNVQEDFMNEADNALYAIKKRLGLPIKSDSVRLVHIN